MTCLVWLELYKHSPCKVSQKILYTRISRVALVELRRVIRIRSVDKGRRFYIFHM